MDVAEAPESLVVSGVPTAVPVPQSPSTIRTWEVAAKSKPLRTCEHATPRVHAKVTDVSDGPAIDAVPTFGLGSKLEKTFFSKLQGGLLQYTIVLICHVFVDFILVDSESSPISVY